MNDVRQYHRGTVQQIKPLLPSNTSPVIRAEQPQTLFLGVILTSISLGAIADVILHSFGSCITCRVFFSVYVVRAVCYTALSKDISLLIIFYKNSGFDTPVLK